ncbi:hypothetical protein [Caldifermentibacillus hisashii]|uniref:hypothetical protein n=1 Tax=Caldifermentibacillus hisashii TaxID=996558 RepID=UPI0022B998C8|nr:hypothetical protein [Caldifermentibacillus hisashii]
MTTRRGLVAKKRGFSAQNDDEKGSRRQKKEFPAQKRRREKVSSLKTSDFRLKMVTRKSLVAKKGSFLPKNDDEKGSRRQKMKFPAQKRRRERVSSLKKVPHTKLSARVSLIGKK